MLFREREAILMRMNEIQLERERLRLERVELRDEYQGYLERLRELDREETKSLDANGVVGELTKAVEALSGLFPKVSVEDLLAKMSTDHLQPIAEEPEPERIAAQPFEVSEQQRRDVEVQTQIKPRKKKEPRLNFNLKKTQSFIRKGIASGRLAEELGEQFRTRELVKYVKETFGFKSMSAQSTSVLINELLEDGLLKRIKTGVFEITKPGSEISESNKSDE